MAGDSILDLFSDGNWRQLLGMEQANATERPPIPPPQMRPQVGFNLQEAPPQPGAPPPFSGPAPLNGPFNSGPEMPGMDRFQVAPPMFGPGAPNMGDAPPQASFPLPPPDAGHLPPNAQPAVGGPPPPMMPPGQLQAPPAPMPPPQAMMSGAAPPAAGANGNLAASLGIDPNRLRSAMAGIGKGMSAVGNMRPGASGGASFAAGLGGGLQGSEAQTQTQEERERQKKNDLFNQSSIAFKDVLAAKNSDSAEAYKQAQSKYLAARAASLSQMTAGGRASNAWQNTPYGKVIGVENEAQKFEKGQQIILQKRWTLNGATPEQQQEDLDRLQKSTDAYRKRLYKSSGIDPDQAEKLKTMGESQSNPFDTKGMTVEQFHQQVPMGGWFKDQNGVVRQRTVAPPGSNVQPSTVPPGSEVNADDKAAMDVE